jgi:hypothetical protein
LELFPLSDVVDFTWTVFTRLSSGSKQGALITVVVPSTISTSMSKLTDAPVSTSIVFNADNNNDDDYNDDYNDNDDDNK